MTIHSTICVLDNALYLQSFIKKDLSAPQEPVSCLGLKYIKRTEKKHVCLPRFRFLVQTRAYQSL